MAMLAQGGIALFDAVGFLALSQTLFMQCGGIQDSEERRRIAAGVATRFATWFVCLFSGIAAPLSCFLTVCTGDGLWLLLAVLGTVYIVTESAKASVTCILLLDHKFTVNSAWLALESMTVVLSTVLCLTYLRGDAGGFVIGYLLGRSVSTVGFVLASAPGHFRGVLDSNFSLPMRQAFRFGAPVAAMGPLGWLSAYADRFIMGAALGSAPTGVYAAATAVVARPYALVTAVLTTYLRPTLYQTASPQGRDNRGFMRVYRRWLMAALFAGVSGTVCFVGLGRLASEVLLAPQFREGAPTLMTVFAIAQTLSIATHAADNALLALRRSKELLVLQAGVAVAPLALLPIGIFFGGTIGAAVARCVAELIKLTVAIGVLHHIVGQTWETKKICGRKRGRSCESG